MNQKKSNSIISKIRNLFTKKEIMENNSVETTQDIKRFQWKKGEYFGKVVELKDEDSEFYIFDDGSRIFKSIASEFLEEVFDLNQLPFPPTNVLPVGEPKNKKEDKPQPNVQVEVQPKKSVVAEKSPLENLIIKLSSKNIETLNLNLGINLPKKEVFDMLLENSDESKDEMVKTISQVVTSQIQIDKLQSYINDQVIIFLNNYYNESNS